MHALLLLLTVLTPPQDDLREVLIRQTEKEPYIAAVKTLERAAELIDSDPREAVAKVNSVLGNAKLIKFDVNKFEGKLKVETRKSEYDRYIYIPFQTRGRAYLSLAKSTSDPNIAKGHWEFAVADLTKSVEAKVPKSADYLKDAKEGLAACIKVIGAALDPAV